MKIALWEPSQPAPGCALRRLCWPTLRDDGMAAKKYWTSPGGKTPGATLYSVILREVQTKGKEARFKKADRGLFETNE